MNVLLRKRGSEFRKSVRVEARLNPEQKRRIEHAARLKGASLSEFIVASADRAALNAIEEHESWALTGADREVFVKALLRAPEPNRRMRAAVKRYQSRVAQS